MPAGISRRSTAQPGCTVRRRAAHVRPPASLHGCAQLADTQICACPRARTQGRERERGAAHWTGHRLRGDDAPREQFLGAPFEKRARAFWRCKAPPELDDLLSAFAHRPTHTPSLRGRPAGPGEWWSRGATSASMCVTLNWGGPLPERRPSTAALGDTPTHKQPKPSRGSPQTSAIPIDRYRLQMEHRDGRRLYIAFEEARGLVVGRCQARTTTRMPLECTVGRAAWMTARAAAVSRGPW